MKFCPVHWQALRSAIADRGLAGFVAKSGEVVVERMQRELQGQADPADWDPLMGAHWAISSRALEVWGLGVLVGETCPLCVCTKPGCDCATKWINGAADDQLGYARHHKLVPEAS